MIALQLIGGCVGYLLIGGLVGEILSQVADDDPEATRFFGTFFWPLGIPLLVMFGVAIGAWKLSRLSGRALSHLLEDPPTPQLPEARVVEREKP